jgi:DNA-cytosine methyltransferase
MATERKNTGNDILPKRILNVLSLFDGMSCGQQALERAGIKVDNYFASEIDKYAIQVTMANYPNTTQLGSVVDVDGYSLPKIDILIGGSPCQSFSFAGKRKGMSTKDEQEILTLDHYLRLKSEGYEFEGQSYLFWEYMRLLNEVKPTYFLLENVMMGEKWEKVLSKAIGVNAIEINSALVSAQNRRRLYWTNIGMEASGFFGDLESIIEQPKDREILLRDVLENEVDDKYFLSESGINRIVRHNNNSLDNNKSNCILAGYYKGGGRDQQYIIHNTMPRSGDPKKGGTGPLSRTDGKTYCLDTGNTNAVEIKGGDFRYDEGFRWRENGKSPTLCLGSENGLSGNALAQINSRIRRLTPIECERLQTVKDNYTNHVSDSQRYKMLGNGWTVEVITHIFKYIKQ